MKHLIFILTVAVLISCGDNNANKNSPTVDISQTSTTNNGQDKIFIQDKLKYSKTFIDELNASNYPEAIKLIDNFIIVGKDTTTFPNDLTINKDYIFKATKDNQRYNLRVRRINQTTLNFNLNLYKNDSLLYADKGDAHLGAMFFLASEGDDDEQSGDGYGSSEYWKKDNDCWVSLRIGIGKDDNGKERAKIAFGCNDKSKKALELENCPTLRTN